MFLCLLSRSQHLIAPYTLPRRHTPQYRFPWGVVDSPSGSFLAFATDPRVTLTAPSLTPFIEDTPRHWFQTLKLQGFRQAVDLGPITALVPVTYRNLILKFEEPTLISSRTSWLRRFLLIHTHSDPSFIPPFSLFLSSL